MKHGNFYGILEKEPGQYTMFIDYHTDEDGRLLRHGFIVDVAAFDEFLRTVCDLPEYEISTSLSNLSNDRSDEHLAEYILLSKHEWFPLDENNERIEEKEVTMFSYVNQ